MLPYILMVLTRVIDTVKNVVPIQIISLKSYHLFLSFCYTSSKCFCITHISIPGIWPSENPRKGEREWRPKGENLLQLLKLTNLVVLRIPEEDKSLPLSATSPSHQFICGIPIIIIMPQINVACLNDKDYLLEGCRKNVAKYFCLSSYFLVAEMKNVLSFNHTLDPLFVALLLPVKMCTIPQCC